MANIIRQSVIRQHILLLRGEKVLLDFHLAQLYEVPTKVLLQAVRRNRKRFPKDFMFQLLPREFDRLRSQFVTSNGRGGRRYLPFAFTEEGVAMLSSVLTSGRSIQVNIAIMRAFVRLREILSTHKDLVLKLDEMEEKYDAQFKVVFDALRQLMQPPEPPKRRIGFQVSEPGAKYHVRERNSRRS
jgi:hypothetical protein